MKKKIIILIPFLTGYGGTETVISNLLSEYNKERNIHDISLELYSLGGYINGDWLRFNNVKIIQFPKERYIREFLYLFLLPLLICYLMIKEHPDYIISTNPIMWTIAKLCSKFLFKDIKIIAWYHYSYRLKPVNSYCLKSPDYFFSISKSGKKELRNLGISSNKIFVVYNPVMPTKQIIKPTKAHNKLIYIGRLEYKGQKNISELFKALGLIKNSSWELQIYGTGPDKRKLQDLSYTLGISSNIKWMGFVENPLSEVKKADALILTSTYEGFSMVLAEAISRGLYVISSDCPSGPSELITSYNGCMYFPGQINSLAHLINNLFEGHITLNQNKSKCSINKFYITNYYHHFVKCIDKLK